MLCRFQVQTTPETNYTAVAARSSPVQLPKWRERLRNYLRRVTNVGISFEIPTYLAIEKEIENNFTKIDKILQFAKGERILIANDSNS